MDETGGEYRCVRYEIRNMVESKNLKTRDHMVDLRVDWKIILKYISKKHRLTTWDIGSNFLCVIGVAALY